MFQPIDVGQILAVRRCHCCDTVTYSAKKTDTENRRANFENIVKKLLWRKVCQ